MHTFTLSFNNKEIEQQYQAMIKKQAIEFQLQQKWIFLVMGIYFIIIKIIEQEWFSLGFIVFDWLVVLFSYKFIASKHKLYDLFLTFAVISYNLYFPIAKYFYSASNENLYIDGYFISVGTFGVISVFSYRNKIIIIGLIFVSLIGTSVSAEENFWSYLVKSTIFTTLYIQNVYCSEKYRKFTFLDNLKKKTILRGIYDFTNIFTYVVHYEADNKKIELVQKDDIQEISKQTLDNFDDFLSNMKIVLQKFQGRFTSIFTAEQVNQSSKRVELKQCLFDLFLNDIKKQNSNQFRSEDFLENNQIYGEAINEQEFYAVQILRCFDIKPCLILVLQEKKKEVQLKELELKNKIIKKSLDQTSHIFKNHLRMSLIYFQWIYKYARKRDDIYLINRCLQSIYGKIIKANNEFQNIIDFNTINQEYDKPFIKKFNIVNCVQEISKFISNYDINKDIRFDIQNQLDDKHQIVNQDEKQVKQLFYNLLFFVSNSSQSVNIQFTSESHGQLNKEVLKIKIEYLGPNLNHHYLQGLQIINPQNLEELLHNSQRPLDLEIPLSLMIIRKLGPYDKMRLQQNKKKQNFLEFYLFQQLEEQYNLIPIYSLHPLNCLILKEKYNPKTKHLISFYDKLLTSPRAQVQNFSEF